MSFIKHMSQTVFVRFLVVAISMGGGVIQARWLGPEGLGILLLLLLVKSSAFRFGNLGFGGAFTFYIAKKKASVHKVFPIALGAGSILSAMIGIALLAVWRKGFSPWNDIRPGLFYLCLSSIPLMFFNSYFQRILSGQLRITAINFGELLLNVSYVSFLVTMVIVLDMGVTGAILSELLSDLVMFCYLSLQVRKGNNNGAGTWESLGRIDFIWRLWRFGRWSYLLMFSTFLLEELPFILLKMFSGNNALLGIFSRARGLERRFRIAATPISQVLFPYTAASSKAQGTERTNVLCRNYTALMAISVPLMALFIKPIILVLYGEAFLPSAKIFWYLMPGIFLWPSGYFITVHLAASGKPMIVFFTSLATVIVTASTCSFLIPRYGAIGAGVSLSVSFATQTLLNLLLYIKYTDSSFSKVLFPKRTDWLYYRRVLRVLSSRFSGKMKYRSWLAFQEKDK